ncbi:MULTISPECIES: sensor histidine kinase [Glutamicibacter]|uniref:histidine kinase n=1 Tax=Glutamicibacter halophytocola TaxID=1933880 RepID=A0AA95BPW5_9MICC|nr:MULTISPECIES: histidine kinase [Glutamicibacter]MBF6670591.1 sensor histidine kinase [Glutamicibacter sp. FBE19]UUX58615.1 histidine kinase [Glutamicibacter halophytocola]
MTSTPWSLAGTSTGRPPLKLGLTLLHLAVLGSFGTIGLSLLIAWLALGLGLVPLLGIGLLFLAALLATLFAVARAEILRISGLYGIDAVPLHWPARRGPGFGEYLRTLGRALGDGRMWAALGSLVLSCIAGTIMLGVLQWTVHFAIISFAPLSSAETVAGPFSLHTPAAQAPWLMLLAIAGAGLVIGTAFLHRSITVGIIGSLARETELTERVRSTTVQREGAVRAAEVERTRIERDLHDGVQPRLVSVAMTLGLAHQQIDSNPEQAKELVAEAHASTKSAITELRQLTRGIYASVLDDRGLDAALSAVAGRSHIPVQLDVQLQGRYPRVAEAAVYFAIAEALTNAAKHSRAQRCLVTVRVREASGQPHLWARVEDNGVGSARITPGGGLDGINNRVLAAGGTLHLQSPAGGPTTVEVSVPCVY